jgi:uncharacterized protein
MVFGSILWRRLDVPGHDACRLEQISNGWRLDGAAAFRYEGIPARLAYQVACDRGWRTREGDVHGWVGAQPVDAVVRRLAGGEWMLNGAVLPDLDGCVDDLDLSFTPATNLFQVQRVALQVGQAADVPVAWLDIPAGKIEILRQRYERRSEATYWYEAPRFNYAALIEVSPVGFVHRYPGLWEAES